jgi:antitoxin component of MazEF toxin-antitoxin module
MNLVKVRKEGESLVITLPRKLVRNKKIKEGQILEITIKKVRKNGFGILKGMRPFSVEDELTTHA